VKFRFYAGISFTQSASATVSSILNAGSCITTACEFPSAMERRATIDESNWGAWKQCLPILSMCPTARL